MPIRFRESKISAHHNYLVNDMLTPGFVVGDPGSGKGFYFLADFVLPGEYSTNFREAPGREWRSVNGIEMEPPG